VDGQKDLRVFAARRSDATAKAKAIEKVNGIILLL